MYNNNIFQNHSCNDVTPKIKHDFEKSANLIRFKSLQIDA